MQTASLLLSPQTVVCDTRGFGLLLGDAEDGSKLRSRPFQSAQVPPEMGRENRFKWGCCVQGRCDPCCPLEQSQSILRADTIQSTVGSSATPQGSERTQTKQMSNAFFLLTGHREIREILLKCCVSSQMLPEATHTHPAALVPPPGDLLALIFLSSGLQRGTAWCSLSIWDFQSWCWLAVRAGRAAGSIFCHIQQGHSTG